MEDLAGVPLLMIDGDLPDYWLEHHVPAHTPAGLPIERGPAVTNMQEALMLVAGGKGALLAAAHTATYLTRPGVAYVPVEDAERVGYGLVWRAGHDTGAVEAFARTPREVTQGDPRTALPG